MIPDSVKTFAPLTLGDRVPNYRGTTPGSVKRIYQFLGAPTTALVYQAHLIFPYPDYQAKEMVIKGKVKLMILPGPPHPPIGHFTPAQPATLCTAFTAPFGPQ